MVAGTATGVGGLGGRGGVALERRGGRLMEVSAEKSADPDSQTDEAFVIYCCQISASESLRQMWKMVGYYVICANELHW